MVSPVAGSGMGSVSSPVPSRRSPPIRLGTVVLMSASVSERRARDELSRALPPVPFAVLHQDLAALHDHLGQALHLPPLVARVVHVHVVGLGGDGPLVVRVEHHDVGVEPRGDRPLARVQPHHPGRRRRHQLHEPVHRDVAVHHALVHQREPVLHARQAVRDLGEVPHAEVLLALVVERRVVGGDHLEVVALQPGPQVLVVVGRPRSRASRTACRASLELRCTMYVGHPASSASLNARETASPSMIAGRVSPWFTGSVLPSATYWSTSTLMGPPFSACTRMSPPASAALRMARKIDASSDMNTPGYAMNSLNDVTPSEISVSISFRTSSLTSRMITCSP